MIQKKIFNCLKNPFQILGGIFDNNKVENKISSLDIEILKKDFWKDNRKSKKVIKEKKFLESIFNFYKETLNELENLKDLKNLALEEKDTDTLKDCKKK